MAACCIFDEDEVCLVTPKRYRYGLVLENAEYLSSDEDNDEYPDNVRRGTVRVAWHPIGNETVVSENEVILADRSLMPGDVVCRSKQHDKNQRGFVQDMEVTCHLRILGTNTWIYNVNSKDVISMEEWGTDPGEVTLDSWFGRIMTVHEDLELKFQDGARCVIDDGEFCGFEDISDRRRGHTEFAIRHYYPGQMLKGVISDLAEGKWTHATKKNNSSTVANKPSTKVSVTIESITTSSVEVHWLCRGFTKGVGLQDKLDPPSRMVKGEELKRMKMLQTFEHCSFQIGDKGYYFIKETDFLSNYPPSQYCSPYQSDKSTAEAIGSLNSDGLKNNFKNNSESVVECCETITSDSFEGMADLEGKGDANSSDDYEDVESDENFDIDSLSSNHSSLDGTHPKKKNKKGAILLTRSRKKIKGKRTKKTVSPRLFSLDSKVPVEIYYTFSQVSVMWQDGSVEKAIPSPELLPIHHLDELEFFPGDFAVHSKGEFENQYSVVMSCDHRERTCMVKWMKPYEGNIQGSDIKPVEISSPLEVSVYDIKDHSDYRFRPGQSVIRIGGFDDVELEAVGQICYLDPEGIIFVQWPSGTTTECYPQDLYIVADENSEFGGTWSSVDDEDDDSDISWETENEEEVDPESDEDKSTKSLWLKQELDNLMERSKSTVVKILTVSESVGDCSAAQCFQEILLIYRKCRDLEKTLESSYFEDEEIVKLVGEVKEAVRLERTARVVKNVMRHVSRGEVGKQTPSPSGVREASVVILETSSSQGNNNLESSSSDSPQIEQSSHLPYHVPHNDNEIQHGCKARTNVNFCCHDKDVIPGSACGEANNFAFTEQLHIASTSGCVSNGCIIESKSAKDAFSNEDAVPVIVSSEPLYLDSLECSDSATDKHLNSDSVECSGIDKPITFDSVMCSDSIIVEASAYPLNVSVSNAPSELCMNTSDSVGEGRLTTHPLDIAMPEEINHAKIYLDLILRLNKLLHDKMMKVQADCWLGDKLKKADCEDGNIDQNVKSNVGPDACVKENVILDKDSRTIASMQVDEDASMDPEDGKNMTDETVPQGESVCAVQTDIEPVDVPCKGFYCLEEVPEGHKFKNLDCHPTDLKNFSSAVLKEMLLLKSSLPHGITVKAFEDRMDLFSVMVVGPSKTPYEDGLFFFDIQLPSDYPINPPVFHYYSYCSERLNPNLYEDGKVCVSLLGTWSGKGTEMWTPKSNMLQALVSIQGLILVGEPYYNEAGYEKQRGTQQGQENSRMYNEMAILKLVQSMSQIAKRPPVIFEEETKQHMLKNGPRMIGRLELWIKARQCVTQSEESSVGTCQNDETGSQNVTAEAKKEKKPGNPQQKANKGSDNDESEDVEENISTDPEFPLLPTSRGFCMAVDRYLQQFKSVLDSMKAW